MKVLIVDDDIATVDVIKNTVDWTDLGVSDVFTAYNIKSAKSVLLDEDIDIVISDIEMPQGSGIDLLEWFRERELDGEFLLLTCHESFDYATHAMKLHAFEYLLKPFDVNVMEATLRKMIRDLNEKRNIKEASEYGMWARENVRAMYNNFWMDIFTAKISPDIFEIKKEIEKRHLDIDPDGLYALVVSRITDTEKDKERLNTNLILFILENIHMEILLDDPMGNYVSSVESTGNIILVSVCPIDKSNPDKGILKIEEKCKKLTSEHGKILASTLTCCISKPVGISQFYDAYKRALDLIEVNVAYYGASFYEADAASSSDAGSSLLKTDVLETLLSQKKKMEFMSALKECLNDKMRSNTLTNSMLKTIQKEVLQVVYTYLGKKDIPVTGLTEDSDLNRLEKSATQSVLDMIRFANYLLDKTYEYEGEVRKSFSLSDKINNYIKEHYSEPIGRNEIAEVFFLAPEYLSKVYKKETGVSLNEAIASVRIEQAKLMLERGERVSDVAEKVGFDNFTYFSTTFKKIEGVSPTQYKKQ